jgi:hypothetical protein
MYVCVSVRMYMLCMHLRVCMYMYVCICTMMLGEKQVEQEVNWVRKKLIK